MSQFVLMQYERYIHETMARLKCSREDAVIEVTRGIGNRMSNHTPPPDVNDNEEAWRRSDVSKTHDYRGKWV